MKNFNYILKTLVLAVTVATIVSCGEGEPMLDTPESYAFFRDGQSTVSFTGQTTRMAMATELIDAMGDLDVESELLLEMFRNATESGGDADPFQSTELNVATKSIFSKVAASQDYFSSNSVESARIRADFEGWITAQVRETHSNAQQLAQPGVSGQIADGSSVRYVSGDGLEYNQAVAKSLIGALMLDQMLNNYLSTSVLDAGNQRADNDNAITVEGKSYTTMEHKWDEAYGYLYGLSSTPAEPLVTLGSDDAFLNKYVGRVEGDVDFEGIAARIQDAFKLGRAAIVARDYDLRDKQAKILRDELSTVIGVRCVYYLQQAKRALSGGDFGGAFHDLSEAYGFIYSLRFTREADGPFADREEVDRYLAELTAGNGFWEVSAETLDRISADIADKYDFTIAQAAE